MKPQEFKTAFHQLTGNSPFPWQEELYRQFAQGIIPASCNLPTGLGKTSVIAIWLIAWINHPGRLPRRLVYVVNRRTVVDQTTNEVEKLRENLHRLNPNPGELAISTLRGQFADNRDWSADPSRPAVISGTVDMIGSRLLFSGYGLGRNSKPHHAGLLGQDVLLVHDEAHLEPAFQELLLSIEKEQAEHERASVPWRKIRVMELSATSRGTGKPFELTAQDKAHPVVKQRIEATKKLRLHSLADPSKLADQLAALAMDHKESGKAILIFARTVDDVSKIAAKLPKDTVRQLTGTMRGFERDQLVRDPIFTRFLPESNRPADVQPAPGTVFLVCTSAGEVGVNISANHLVCDLSTFESMAQRFGRVNRFGFDTDTRVDVVHPTSFEDDPKRPLEPRREKTLALLVKLKGDASPNALDNLDKEARLAGFAPTPVILAATDILFDSWSLTTIREKLPGRPPVEPYLHGIAEWEPKQTQLAWREEVGVIKGPLLDEYDPEDLLEDYPLKPHELLKDRSERVWKELAAMAARENGKHAETPVWLVDEDDTVEVVALGILADKEQKQRIESMTVLLPPEVGGLTNGMLDGKSPHANDVSDVFTVRVRRDGIDANVKGRVRVWDSESNRKLKIAGMRFIRRINLAPVDDDGAANSWCWYERAETGDTDGSRAASAPVLCEVHTGDVVREAGQYLSRLAELPDELRQAIKIAAKYHDQGKCRDVFQRMLGNNNPSVPWAKSGGWRTPRDIRVPYRHEFGSMLDIKNADDFRLLTGEMQDLVLHLIAAHHGRARPHFTADETSDPDYCDAATRELAGQVPRRFARLHRKFGRWGLAYIESLLRAADHAASAKPSRTVEELP